MGKKFQCKNFEGGGKKFLDTHKACIPETSANIFESMLRSPAYMRLTDKQRNLYVVCKAQYYGKRKPSKDYGTEIFDDQCFYLNWEGVQHYGLYKDHSHFYRDMSALIAAGFIERVSSGAGKREKSIYRYSSKWWNSWSEFWKNNEAKEK